jgi:REP element-mobilizing transposase RayT
MKDYRVPLEPDNYYHIFNHAVSNRQIFLEERNYEFFLSKYVKYINPYVDTFAFCLLPNHFHFLIKPIEQPNPPEVASGLSNRFKNFFNSYSQSFNKTYKLRGSLFEPRFKRRKLESKNDILNCVLYIHLNPIKHRLANDLQEWKHCSYTGFSKEKFTFIKKDEVIDWFDDLDNFNFMHQKKLSEFQ